MNTPVNQALLQVSVNPHVRTRTTVPSIMALILVGLLPVGVAAIAAHGTAVMVTIVAGVAGAVVGEWAATLMRRRPSTISDWSALVSGVMLALMLPVSVPWWMAAVGALFGILVVKQLFGGLGHYFISPVLGGYAFIFISYPAVALVADRALPLLMPGVYNGLLWGSMTNIPGQTSVAALLLGALFLWHRKLIGFIVPICVVTTVFLLYWISGWPAELFSAAALQVPLMQIASGGLLFIVLFVATDSICTPLTIRGKIVFGMGCALLIWLLRGSSASALAVCYAVLLMQCVVPLIDMLLRPRWLGQRRRRHA